MCILGKIIQKESSSLPQSIKAKNLDNTLFEVANYISLICAERLGHLIVLQLKHSTFQPRGNAQTLLDWNLLFSYFYYGTLITVAITTILGLISESFMASRLG